MFDRKTVDAYKSISPPDKMKENIIRMYEGHKKPGIYSRLKLMSGIAACFLIVFTAAALYFSSIASLTITNSGEKVSRTPMTVAFEDVPYSSNSQSISMFRMETPVLSCIALDIDTNEKTEISVSGGTLLLYDAGLDNTFYTGEYCVIDASSRVYWSIDDFLETDVYTMHLVTKKETTNLSLSYNKDSEAWMLANTSD